MNERDNAATKNLNDGRKQALRALVSSLAPNDSSQEKRLSEGQVDALSERLNHILGNVEDGLEVRRNEKGEVLNEEGLPVVDITEPLGDESQSFQAPEAFLSGQDPPPLSTMSERDREQLRIRQSRILDILEEEERRESERELERERKRRLEEVAKMDAESKAAAREMQKKMGKALLKNLAAQREKEEEERKKTQETVSAELSPRNGSATCKKKKSVSFANVPETDEEKPKPPVAWGDVSVAKLKSGGRKARLKSEAMNAQPMKLEVVERVPGVKQEQARERDSDDESNGDVEEPKLDEDSENVGAHSFYDDYDVDERTRLGGDSDEDEFDFSQASVQREVALEYIHLRERVGADARQAMTSHTYEPENEWDQPKVPLEASLASKPIRPGVSRFKAERQASPATSGDTSVSLEASVLPEIRSSTLRRAVRTGKLVNGQLMGEGSDSELDEEERENVNRMIEALKQGVISDDTPASAINTEARTACTSERNAIATLPVSELPRTRAPDPKPAGRLSRFKTERASQSLASDRAAFASNSVAFTPSTLSNAVLERPMSSKSSSPVSTSTRPSAGDRPPIGTFRKPPTVVSVPSAPPAGRIPFAKPQISPDPAVLNNMIIDSPSFPPPSSNTHPQPGSHPPPLVSEVRESVRRVSNHPCHPDESTQRSGKVSRFKAERTQGLM